MKVYFESFIIWNFILILCSISFFSLFFIDLFILKIDNKHFNLIMKINNYFLLFTVIKLN